MRDCHRDCSCSQARARLSGAQLCIQMDKRTHRSGLNPSHVDKLPLILSPSEHCLHRCRQAPNGIEIMANSPVPRRYRFIRSGLTYLTVFAKVKNMCSSPNSYSMQVYSGEDVIAHYHAVEIEDVGAVGFA